MKLIKGEVLIVASFAHAMLKNLEVAKSQGRKIISNIRKIDSKIEKIRDKMLEYMEVDECKIDFSKEELVIIEALLWGKDRFLIPSNNNYVDYKAKMEFEKNLKGIKQKIKKKNKAIKKVERCRLEIR